MREVSFSIPLSGIIRFDEDTISVTINRAETTIKYEPARSDVRISLEKGKTLFDVVLEAAQKYVRFNQENRFSAAALYYEALPRYPGLKRNSWTSHVIACAPNHSSYQHYGVKRDYFKYLGDGTYELVPKYVDANSVNTEEERKDGTKRRSKGRS